MSLIYALIMSTNILNYFKRTSDLPDPYGELSRKLPRETIASANKEVAKVKKRSTQCGKYNKYTPEVRANIGRMATLIGPHSTAVRYTKLLGINVRESTVRGIMKSYREVHAGKRRLPTANDGELQSLPAKKHGSHYCWVIKSTKLYNCTF